MRILCLSHTVAMRIKEIMGTKHLAGAGEILDAYLCVQWVTS